eukprot:gene9415-biopygen1580
MGCCGTFLCADGQQRGTPSGGVRVAKWAGGCALSVPLSSYYGRSALHRAVDDAVRITVDSLPNHLSQRVPIVTPDQFAFRVTNSNPFVAPNTSHPTATPQSSAPTMQPSTLPSLTPTAHPSFGPVFC